MPAVVIWAATTVAVAANILFVWPQVLKLIRTRDLDGISPGTWTISVVLFSVWSVFALKTSYWSLFVANASCLVAASILLVVGTRLGWSKKWVGLCVLGMLCAAFFGLVLPVVLAVVLTGAGVALRLPQLVTLLRAPTVDGVSAQTWLLSGLTAGSWLIVSIHRHATAVIVANSTALAATLILLAVLELRRRRLTGVCGSLTALDGPTELQR